MTITVNPVTPIPPKPLSQKDKTIYFFKKAVAIALIITPFYHIFDAIRDMLIVFPQISFAGQLQQSQTIYLSLLKKAIIISFGLFFDSFYGFVLLVKPRAATKIIHIVFGIFILILSQILFRLAAIDQILSQIHLFPVI